MHKGNAFEGPTSRAAERQAEHQRLFNRLVILELEKQTGGEEATAIRRRLLERRVFESEAALANAIAVKLQELDDPVNILSEPTLLDDD